jgi:hypothetical protein
MADMLLLTGRCERRRHVMFRVFDSGDGLVLEAPLYCAGRERETWTPMRRRLEAGRASRYGCPCRATVLASDQQMTDRIHRGIAEWVVAVTNISLR